MTWWMYILLLLAAGTAYEVHTRRARERTSHLVEKPLHQLTPMAARKPQAAHVHTELRDWPEAVASWVIYARRARVAGDIDNARMGYQKAAYGFSALTPAQNQVLKREVAAFVHEDPRYQAGLISVQAEVARRPGVLQSELGKSVGDQREALNYVLYFADVTGDIVRVKQGRSYALHLPGVENKPKPAELGLTAQISVRDPTAAEKQMRALHLRATELKSDDLPAAVQCLREAQTIAKQIEAYGHPIEFWTRLPMFLQKTGEMIAAEAAFDEIERDISAGRFTKNATSKKALKAQLARKRTLAREREAKRLVKTSAAR